MSRLTLLLTASTLVFAASTAWLALELHEERQRSQQARVPPGTGLRALGPRSVAPRASGKFGTDASGADSAGSDALAADAAKAGASVPQGADPPRPRSAGRGAQLIVDEAGDAAVREDYLRRSKDPNARLEMLAQEKSLLRMEYPELARHARLTSAEVEALLDLLAEQALEQKEWHMRCQKDPRCHGSPDAPSREARRQQVAALLGSDKFDRYFVYANSVSERTYVGRFNTRLGPASSLSEVAAERLIAALAEERTRATEGALQNKLNYYSIYSLSGGQLVITVDAESQDARSRIEAATLYSRRLRDRAAEVLTPQQLNVFNQMQDELLQFVQGRLREEAVEAAARDNVRP